MMVLCLCPCVAKAQNLHSSSPEAEDSVLLENIRQLRGKLISAQDSTTYISQLETLYEHDPYNETYFAWILEFYDHPKQRYKLEDFVDDQLEDQPHSTMPWILKAEIAMHAKRWEEAAEAYKTACNIDPHSLPIIYNVGLSLSNQAIDIQRAILNKERALKKEDQQKIKQTFIEAEEYLEKAKAMDPKRKKVDWVTPLYIVYFALGETEKARELEPLVTGFKNTNQERID
jgi:tetratricopeptide (TPR) repeat protein